VTGPTSSIVRAQYVTATGAPLSFVRSATRQSRPEWPVRRERTGTLGSGPHRQGAPLQSCLAASVGGEVEPETPGAPSRPSLPSFGLGTGRDHDRPGPGSEPVVSGVGARADPCSRER